MATEHQEELEAIKTSLWALEEDVLPVVKEIAQHTMTARRAMNQDPVDTFTLSNELVNLSILIQRFGDRLAMMGYIARSAKEFYERTRENHKVRLVRDDKIAAGVADSMKLELCKEEFEIHNQCEYTMSRLAYTRKSTDKTIDAVRSKLSYEKTSETR